MTSAGTGLSGQQSQHSLDPSSQSASAASSFVEQQPQSPTSTMSATTIYPAPYYPPPASAFNYKTNNPHPQLFRRPSQPGGMPVPSNQCTPVPASNPFGASEQQSGQQGIARQNVGPPLPHSSSIQWDQQVAQSSIIRTNPTTPITHTPAKHQPRISSTSTPASPIESTVHLDIVYHPVTEIVAMLAAKLQNLITTNDRVKHSSSSNLSRPGSSSSRSETRLLSFHARNIPSITITAYLNRILKYCPTDPEVFISVLVYFDRILRIASTHAEPIFGSYYTAYNPLSSPPLVHSPAPTPSLEDETFTIDSFNVHRLVITTIAVATKFFSDQFYTNSRYARVGGLPLAELNHLEIQFLILHDFNLMIPPAEIQFYADRLLSYWLETQRSSFMGIPPPAPTNLETSVTPSSTIRNSDSSALAPNSSSSTNRTSVVMEDVHQG